MLLIFDIDGTLVERGSTELLPGRQEFFESLDKEAHIALASNQGGPACRAWSNRYPSLDEVKKQMKAVRLLISETASRPVRVYMCLVYVDKSDAILLPDGIDPNDPRANPKWRKPAPGMLLQAALDFDVRIENVMFVGDRDEDRGAAHQAGCSFIWAKDFFTSL